jgi:hypothetical protein
MFYVGLIYVAVLREGFPKGSIGEFWWQVSQSNAFRFHPSNRVSYRGDFSRGVFANSFPISSIQDVVYKMEFSEFYENMSACPVYLEGLL